MTLVKYRNLWDELEDFPRSLGLFQETFQPSAETGIRPWAPAVDVIESENDLSFTVDLPGMKQEDIDVHLENGTLTIKGQRKFEHEEQKKGYHRIERSYGSFSRAFALPDTVDTEHINASYKDGVLTVKAAKREAAKPRSVKVAVNNN
ncbi:MAG: Hsp20/alpha crystallin family protein [Acidobacteriota bacterium]